MPIMPSLYFHVEDAPLVRKALDLINKDLLKDWPFTAPNIYMTTNGKDCIVGFSWGEKEIDINEKYEDADRIDAYIKGFISGAKNPQ